MPWTAAMFLVGAVAICGLPPLNGFVSELLVYLGLFGTAAIPGGRVSAAVVAAPILAMIGALALACFVKVYGIVFLGSPRRRDSVPARESPASMLAPMLFLAGCCFAIGCAATLLGPLLDSAIAAASPQELPRVAALAPLTAVGIASGIAIAVIASIAAFQSLRARRVRRAPTWDCGYASPGPRMQYTASSFARTIESMFAWALRPRAGPFDRRSLPSERGRMESHVDDAVLDSLIVPAARGTQRLFGWFRRPQQGLTQHYILYVLVALALLLGTLIPFGDLISRLFER